MWAYWRPMSFWIDGIIPRETEFIVNQIEWIHLLLSDFDSGLIWSGHPDGIRFEPRLVVASDVV